MARGSFNASQAGSNSRGGAVGDKDVEAAVLRVLNTKLGLSERMVQQLQELTGLRGRASDGTYPGEAVRRQDLAAVAQLDVMQAKQVTAAPTAADFNALLADVSAIYQMLVAITKATAV